MTVNLRAVEGNRESTSMSPRDNSPARRQSAADFPRAQAKSQGEFGLGTKGSPMLHLILENVRTFSGVHRVPIKPLTFLIGENSSGKTTILGMLAALNDRAGFPLQPNFNQPPYNLGNYDTIATYKGGRFGRASHFSLGFERGRENPGPVSQAQATYESSRGQVRLVKFKASGERFSISLKMLEDVERENRGAYSITFDGKTYESEFVVPQTRLETGLTPLATALMSEIRPQELTESERTVVFGAMNSLWQMSPLTTLSVAPIRTKPERTYSQVTETYKPTGDHIPFLLEQLLREGAASKEREQVLSALKAFGDDSGLFKRVTVKHLGEKPSDPFQVMVTVAGRAANLVDVGYGISQALPVVVEASMMARAPARGHLQDQFLLLQQPEIHLHPRAQAALGSFFSRLAQVNGNGLIVETHSDYIIDRVRQEVARKRLEPDKVVMLYCHRDGLESRIHAMNIDSAGNIRNAPPYYREFFLREELDLLNRVAEN